MKIAFIGLGIMGSRMASNLLKNGQNVTVYNRTKAAAEALITQGAIVADTVTECVKDADVVFTMLSTPEVVDTIAFGKNGFVEAMKPNAIWADSSTVNPSFSVAMGQKAESAGIRFLDIPVAGSKNQAAGAQLVFFVGGEAPNLNEISHLLDLMGKKTLHVGGVGQGASLKMLVNAMLGQSMVIFAESVLLGEKMGINRDFLLNLLPNLVVTAPFVKFKTDNIKNDNYPVEFPLEWLHKDMHLAALSAYEHDVPFYIGNLTKELFASAKREGLEREDFSAIFRYLEAKR